MIPRLLLIRSARYSGPLDSTTETIYGVLVAILLVMWIVILINFVRMWK